MEKHTSPRLRNRNFVYKIDITKNRRPRVVTMLALNRLQDAQCCPFDLRLNLLVV